MRTIGLSDQTLYADLLQKARDAEFDRDFPPNGSFQTQVRRGRPYVYYRGYDRSTGKDSLRYVGPASDGEIQARVEAFALAKAGYRERRSLASRLRSAGLPSPTRFEGEVVEALSRARLFRLRAVLVGSLAYQAYSAHLGVRLPEAQMRTGDADVAQFFGISDQIDDRADDVETALRAVDPTFRPRFNPESPTLVAGFVNATDYKVEFLTPNRGSSTYGERLAPMPALGPGIGAQALPFLDFLIRDPVPALLLHEAGLPVTVPSPDRYAVHKLLLSTLRGGTDGAAKKAKDLTQAASLVEAHRAVGDAKAVGFAWMEAWERGGSWRRRLLFATRNVSDATLGALAAAVRTAAEMEAGDPADYGLDGGREEVALRLAGRWHGAGRAFGR